MDWLGLVLGLVKLLGVFSEWLHDRKLINDGQMQQLASDMKGQADALAKAAAAREAVRSDVIKHPDRVSDDDGFRRD